MQLSPLYFCIPATGRRRKVATLSLDMLPDCVLFHLCIHLPRDRSYLALKCCCKRLYGTLASRQAFRCERLRLEGSIHVPLLLGVLIESPKLWSLDLSGCIGATDDLLAFVSRQCPGITDVDISGCVLVTDAALKKLGRNLRCLRSLAVRGLRHVTSNGIISLLHKHKESILHLDLTCCYGLQMHSYRLSYMTEFCPNLLSLGCGWDPEHAGWIPMWEMRMRELCELCPKLERLDLSCSPARDIREVVESVVTTCPVLRHIDLSRCIIRDAGLMAITKGIPTLESLTLAHCSNLSDAALNTISLGLLSLTHLNINHCYRLTNYTVTCLLSRLPLQQLHIRGCFIVNDESLSHATSYCSTLLYLDASGTMLSQQVAKQMRDLAKARPFLLRTEECPFMEKFIRWKDLK